MLDPQAAEKLISAHLACLPIESLPVGQCAGAVLRENVYAERDQPPFDRVTMDGIALAASAAAGGRRRFRLQATQAAGDPPTVLASDEHCIEVMTGAVLPGGCDTVVPVEMLRSAEGYVELQDGLVLAPWGNIHRRASDRRQGALLLAVGSVLHAPEIAVAASAGMARVRVSSQPAIVVISTGNELVEPGDPIEPHPVRRSNAYAVAAALRQRGFHRVADDHVPDDAQQLRERLRLHLNTHEVLILSGGVSMGRFDLVPKALEDIGVRCVLHGIAQRPGRPMWYGTSSEGHSGFGVPVVASGRAPRAPPIRWPATLTGFVPVRVAHDDWARPWATPCPTNGSGDFASLALTDGFIELPPGPADFAKGYVSRLYRW